MPVERRAATSLAEYLSNPAGFKEPAVCNPDEAVERTFRIYEESGREGVTFSLYFGNQLNQPLFSVGLLPDLFPLPEQGRNIDRQDLLAFVRGNQGLLKHPAHSVGLWYDAGDDQVFMDVVVLVLDKDEAISLGTEYNQKCIFNLQTGEVIWLEGTGEPIG